MSSIRISKTYDQIRSSFNKVSDKEPRNKVSYIKVKKKDFVYYLDIKHYNDGLISMVFDILCVKEKWENDKETKKCRICQEEFSFFNRKHHCRCCGMIFCFACSRYELKINVKLFHTDSDLITTFKKSFNCIYDRTQ